MGSKFSKKKTEDKLTPKKIIEHNRKLSRNSLTPGPYKLSPRREKKKSPRRLSSRSPTRSQTTASRDISLSFGPKRKRRNLKRRRSKKLKTKYT